MFYDPKNPQITEDYLEAVRDELMKRTGIRYGDEDRDAIMVFSFVKKLQLVSK